MTQSFDIREQLMAHGLSHVADKIVSFCMPAVRLHLTPAAPQYVEDASLLDTSPVGLSKVGGYPDFPPDLEWPYWACPVGEPTDNASLDPPPDSEWPYWENMPLPFLAQFRMSDVAPFDTEGILPESGMLYFFWDVTMTPYGYGIDAADCKVVHYDGDLENLKRTPSPSGLVEYGETNPNRIEFAMDVTVPSPDSDEIRELLTIEEDQARYYEFLRAFYASKQRETDDGPADNSHHYLLGCPLVLYNEQRPNMEWRLLLVMDTDRHAGLNWGDAGIISFLIHQDNLRLGRFDEMIVTYEGH